MMKKFVESQHTSPLTSTGVIFVFVCLFCPVIALQISLLKSGFLFSIAVVRHQGGPDIGLVSKREGQGDSCHGVSTMLRRLS